MEFFLIYSKFIQKFDVLRISNYITATLIKKLKEEQVIINAILKSKWLFQKLNEIDILTYKYFVSSLKPLYC